MGLILERKGGAFIVSFVSSFFLFRFSDGRIKRRTSFPERWNPETVSDAVFCFICTSQLKVCSMEQVYWHRFFSSTCSPCVFVSHFGSSHNISFFSLLLHLLRLSVISHLWLYYCNCSGHTCKMVSLIDKCVCSDCSIYRPFPHLSFFLGLYFL